MPNIKKSKSKSEKKGNSRQIAKPEKQEGSGIGGVQLGTQTPEKPSAAKTGRQVRDLG